MLKHARIMLPEWDEEHDGDVDEDDWKKRNERGEDWAARTLAAERLNGTNVFICQWRHGVQLRKGWERDGTMNSRIFRERTAILSRSIIDRIP